MGCGRVCTGKRGAELTPAVLAPSSNDVKER